MLYGFVAENKRYVMAIRSQSMHKDDHIKLKLPGGTSVDLHNEYFHYENALFDTLLAMKFEKKAQQLIYKNETPTQNALRRIWAVRKSWVNPAHISVKCPRRSRILSEWDIEPTVLSFDQKGGHTQYFLHIEQLIDSKGKFSHCTRAKRWFSSAFSQVGGHAHLYQRARISATYSRTQSGGG